MELEYKQGIENNILCTTLVEQEIINAELIKTLVPCLYLEIGNDFIYLDELSSTDFLLFQYLKEKEIMLRNFRYREHENEETLVRLLSFKDAIYRALKIDDYYKALFLKVAV